MTSPYRVEIYDSVGQRIGVLPQLTSLTAVGRWCDVGTYEVVAPTRYATQLGAGAAVAIYQTGLALPVLSGPVTNLQQDWSSTNPGGQVTVNGVSDEVWIADRLAYPDPTQPANNQTASARDTQTGIAETLMYSYARRNAGPSALSARQVSGLGMYPDQARGSSLTWSTRFDRLSDILTSIGNLSTPHLGWRVFRDVNGLTFQVVQPTDRTGVAHFSKMFGNLRGLNYTASAPGTTRAIVAGAGVGTARTIREVADTSGSEAAWGRRIETFVDQRQESSGSQLDQAGIDQLVQDAAMSGAAITPVDLPLLRFGVDYFLGDTVLVEVDGQTVSDVVREVTVTWDADNGPKVEPTIGNASLALGYRKFFQRISTVEARVGYIEKSQ